MTLFCTLNALLLSLSPLQVLFHISNVIQSTQNKFFLACMGSKLPLVTEWYKIPYSNLNILNKYGHSILNFLWCTYLKPSLPVGNILKLLLKINCGLLGSQNWFEWQNIATVFFMFVIRSLFWKHNPNFFIAYAIFCCWRTSWFLSTTSMLLLSVNKSNFTPWMFNGR